MLTVSMISTAVAGIECRGFIFAAPVALGLKVPFVPFRKPGKLPCKLHASYFSFYEIDLMATNTQAKVSGSNSSLDQQAEQATRHPHVSARTGTACIISV
jgi:hypothetical protein